MNSPSPPHSHVKDLFHLRLAIQLESCMILERFWSLRMLVVILVMTGILAGG